MAQAESCAMLSRFWLAFSLVSVVGEDGSTQRDADSAILVRHYCYDTLCLSVRQECCGKILQFFAFVGCLRMRGFPTVKLEGAYAGRCGHRPLQI